MLRQLRRLWNRMPRPIRRIYVCGSVALAVAILPQLLIVLAVFGVFGLSPSDEVIIKQVKWYALLPILAVFCGWLIVSHVRFVRRLRALEYRMCLRCGYSLVHLPSRHICPECGLAYDAAELRSLWLGWLDVPWHGGRERRAHLTKDRPEKR